MRINSSSLTAFKSSSRIAGGASRADRRSPGGCLGPARFDVRCHGDGDRLLPRSTVAWLGPSRTGVVEVVGDRLRFTHPLLGSAVDPTISLARRRELHARLATSVDEPQERALLGSGRSRARTSPSPSPSRKPRRSPLPGGAPQSAAELVDGPPSHPGDRVEHLGVALIRWGCGSLRVRGHLAGAERPGASGGPLDGRAVGRVLLDLGMGIAEAEGWREPGRVSRPAPGEAGIDLALRALIEQNLGYAWLFRGDLAGIGRMLAPHWSWPRSCRTHG